MVAALSTSAAAVASAATATTQGRITATDDHDEDYDYWSTLPDDILLTIMAALDVLNLRPCSAVCKSWSRVYKALRLPSLEQAPCLLYAGEQYGPNNLALYCPISDATFRVPFPGPPHYKRGFTFSCPRGWVFTTDAVGNPYLLNPITGVQATLPPVNTIYERDNYYDEHGRHKHVWDTDPEEEEGSLPCFSWARHSVFFRVAMSVAADVTQCTVLIVHMPFGRLSFTRPGDNEWTLLSERTFSVCDILYNESDGLFYILYGRGSICTLDLSGPSPTTKTIMRRVLDEPKCREMYLALGVSGELLQVWRNWEHVDSPRKYRDVYKEIMNGACKDRIDFLGRDDNNKNKLSDLETNEEEDELHEAIRTDEETDFSQWLREGIDLPHRLTDEVTTNEILVFKVDKERKKLVELKDIGDHALFIGRNSAVCLPIKDYQVFEPNCIYLTDDCINFGPILRKDLGIWNIKKRSMQKLGDVWPNLHPWLHLPAPIWIMPRF
ncbi:uncharacterized protein [Lolium perenne]|uniref:uncharacterized protein n=1 Tax=Lolium perenne TaxID=4522 RepID=UPI0021F5E108|nr:uncharacterized protein LOC127346521 [Lolium perenne]